MRFIKRMVIKWRLLMAKRQLSYMEKRKSKYGARMGSLELVWLKRDIYRQQSIIYGLDLELISLDIDDNDETETLSSNSVSPLRRY